MYKPFIVTGYEGKYKKKSLEMRFFCEINLKYVALASETVGKKRSKLSVNV